MQSVSRLSASLLGRVSAQQGPLRSLLLGSHLGCLKTVNANFASASEASCAKTSEAKTSAGGAQGCNAKANTSGDQGCNAKGAGSKDQKGAAPSKDAKSACGKEANKCGAGSAGAKGADAKSPSGKGADLKKPEMKLEKIPVEKLKDIVEHQKHSFYCSDPVTMALGMCQDENSLKMEMEQTKKTIEEGMSVMAVADGKVVAAHVNGLMCPGNAERDAANIEDPKNPLEKIKYLKAKANSKVDLFKKFGVDAIYDMKMLSVDENYICPNAAFEAIKLDEKIAREAGFKLIKAEASGIYAEDLLEKLGFEIVSETRYDSVLDKDCKVMIPVKEPNTSYKIMVKKL